jgi:cytochrome oxidase Cu insertion factor (SCO1/SenC/PrrC family)
MSESGRSTAPRGQRRSLAALVAVVFLAGGVLIALGLTAGLRSQPPSDSIGGPFALIAHNGQKLTDHEFRGKWLLMYFGYTHCPDICPTTLAEISETLKLLGPLAAEVQPLFVTIDPERDTPDVVGTFVDAFDAHIIGLSGTLRRGWGILPHGAHSLCLCDRTGRKIPDSLCTPARTNA